MEATSASRKVMAWVGSDILPHEADLRKWLRRMVDPVDIEDIVQESYCRLSRLASIDHIESGRAYLFTTARRIVIERVRRARIVNIQTVTEIDALDIVYDEPSPERVAAGRRELERVKKLIEGLPDRCRQVFEMRKIHGISQREIAQKLGINEHIVENDVMKGLRIILKALAEGEDAAEQRLKNLVDGRNERTRNSTADK